ncbi:MAG: multiubiquitin domain-containing protein [Rhodospirillaceae bacterium]
MTDNVGAHQSEPGVEAVLNDIIDLADYAKAGKAPPLAKGYRLKVNGESYVVHDPIVTGREILTLAGLLPAEDYTLRVKFTGERPKKVGLNEELDLRHRGVEKFKALPRDQTEG